MEDDKGRNFADDLLEAALARHASEGPRPGLEARILANVSAAERAQRPRAWAMGLGLAAATVLIVVVAMQWPRSVRKPAPAESVPTVAANKPEPALTVKAPKPRKAATRLQRARPAEFRMSRPAQFPTPAPLTEQEKLLLLYVKTAPKSVLAATAAKSLDEPLEIPDLKIASLKIKELPEPKD